VSRRTPGGFRTRVLTEGVVPSLHVQYKKSKVKQYHKEGQALRTETTVNDTYDFAIGRALRNLPALREIGFAANRRLLRVESLSHDCLIGEDQLTTVMQPVVVNDQRAAGLRFGDRRVHALLHTLCLFALLPSGFRHGDIRAQVGQLLGRHLDDYTTGQMTYDLRRLRLHGLIERVPQSHRYRITPFPSRPPRSAWGPMLASLASSVLGDVRTGRLVERTWAVSLGSADSRDLAQAAVGPGPIR
jgi:hypothetical protein